MSFCEMRSEPWYPRRYSVPSPSTSAPTNVSGRLFSFPMTAAAYAFTTSSVSGRADSLSEGAISTPAIAASTVPTDHEAIEMT
uniref:Unannotated protein n=1 Tax=freshwater metagenome TaxID=449393 RepID=A0A6J7QA09_9ZZZZ